MPGKQVADQWVSDQRVADQVGPSQAATDGRVRVLVVGPCSAVGGLAHVARQTLTGFDADHFDIAACDVTRVRRAGHGRLASLSAHGRQWWGLARALRANPPAVVHLHTCSYGTYYRTLADVLACRLCHCPYVLHVHGGLFAEFLDGLRGGRRRLVLAGLRGAAAVIVLGEAWKQVILRHVPGACVVVVPNGIESVVPPSLALERGGGVLFVGDLSEVKRPEDALVAYSGLPRALRTSFALTLLGGGTVARRRRLEELARRLGIAQRVLFAGQIAGDEVEGWMRRADVLILPSRAEGMPVALLEAMSAGLPVLATRVGAVAEMIRDGTDGILVEPLNAAALSAALRTLLTDDRLRRELAASALRRVTTEFSAARFRAAVGTVWRDVARGATQNSALPSPRLLTSASALLL